MAELGIAAEVEGGFWSRDVARGVSTAAGLSPATEKMGLRFCSLFSSAGDEVAKVEAGSGHVCFLGKTNRARGPKGRSLALQVCEAGECGAVSRSHSEQEV